MGFSTAKSVEVGIVFHCKICRSGYSLFCRLVFHSKSVEMGIVCNLYTYSSTIVTKLSKIARQGQLYLSKICRYGYKFGKKICMGGWVFSFPVRTPRPFPGLVYPQLKWANKRTGKFLINDQPVRSAELFQRSDFTDLFSEMQTL